MELLTRPACFLVFWRSSWFVVPFAMRELADGPIRTPKAQCWNLSQFAWEVRQLDHDRCRDWFSHGDDVTEAPEVVAALSGRAQGADSLAAIELGADEEGRCPCCGSGGAVWSGRARGLHQYRCKSCGKMFGALTGTTLSGLHHKDRWLAFGMRLGESETIRDAAVRSGTAPSTAFRWRHRFVEAVRPAPLRLAGSSRPMRTSFLRAGRESGNWSASYAGAAAKHANAASRASMCRSWSPPVALARPSATERGKVGIRLRTLATAGLQTQPLRGFCSQ